MIEATTSPEARAAAEPVASDDLQAAIRTLLRAIPPLADRLLATRRGRVHRDAVALLESALLAHVLMRSGGKQLRAARALGLNRNTLRKRCRELGLQPASRPRRLRPGTDSPRPPGFPRDAAARAPSLNSC